jgi:hypothetical protein
MSPDTRLPLHVQKAVLGRALVYKALDLHRAEIEAADYGVLWGELRGRLCTLTERQLRFDQPEQSLCNYLKQLAQDLRGGLAFPDHESAQTITPLLDFIDQMMEEVAQVQHDLLEEAFREALHVAAAEYVRHGLQVPDDLVKRASIAFDHQENMGWQALPIQLTAVTLLHSTEPHLSAIVQVLLSPRFLDEQTVFALPYVLLHECLCHVLQGPWAVGRMQADANSRFAEGWMDVVAYRLHAGLDAAFGNSSIADLMSPLRWAAQMEAADAVYTARHAPQEADRAWSHRALGTDAANFMLRLLGRLPDSRQDPGTPFMHLSVTLNASPLDNTERDRFVGFVHSCRNSELRCANFVPPVREYLQDGDTINLVARTLEVSRPPMRPLVV